jgi:hypothetical protein
MIRRIVSVECSVVDRGCQDATSLTYQNMIDLRSVCIALEFVKGSLIQPVGVYRRPGVLQTRIERLVLKLLKIHHRRIAQFHIEISHYDKGIRVSAQGDLLGQNTDAFGSGFLG